jgi:hypothetical protein
MNQAYADALRLLKVRDQRIRVLEAALREIVAKGREHPDPYIEGAWFAQVAETAVADSGSGKQSTPQKGLEP